MPQKQARKPKSHRGCTACRTSKRKCSEDKPSCENCIRDGKECQYDIDVLFRIQTYDGTQQPNRRMRQIITPISKMGEPSKSGSSNSSRRSSASGDNPLVGDLGFEKSASRQSSGSGSSRSLKGGSSPLANARAYQTSYAQSTLQPEVPNFCSSPSLMPTAVSSYPPSITPSMSSSPLCLLSQPLPMVDLVVPTWNTEPSPMNIAPSKTVLSEDETVFVGFFLNELPALLPLSELFPSLCNDIWAMSVTHAPLTHSILAISSYLSGRQSEKPSAHSLAYLQKALAKVQSAISLGFVDEGLIAAEFLLALLSILTGDYASTRRHLQSMSQLLQFYNQRNAYYVPSTSIVLGPNGYPIVMLLWRMAIRLEHHVAFYSSGQEPIFPIVRSSQESTNLEWISEIIDESIPDGVNWALASFALDDLMTRARHLSYEMSGCSLDSFDRAFRIQELVEEYQSWKRRPVVSRTVLEKMTIQPDTVIDPLHMPNNITSSVLDYPPTRVQNDLYATLLARHFMIGIYLSLISDPCPAVVAPERFQAAIDICGYFVAMYGDPSYTGNEPPLQPVEKCVALITAGFTLHEEDCVDEFGYCVRTLSAIARETGFMALLDVVEILKMTHKEKIGNMNWAKGYQMKVAPSPGLRWDWLDAASVNDLESMSQVAF